MTGQIEVIEYFDDRFYKIQLGEAEIALFKELHPDKGLVEIDGQFYYYFPSVTTQLAVKNEFALNKWRGDVGNDVANLRLRLAGVEGNICHDAWDKLQEGHILDVKDYEQTEWIQIVKFQRMFKSFKPKIIHREVVVYDIPTLTAGRLDWIWYLEAGEYDNGMAKPIKLKESGLYIWDGKTANGLFKKHYYQLGKYGKMFEQAFGETLKGGFIFHSKAQTKSKWKADFVTPEQLTHYENMFNSLSKVWQDDNPTKPTTIDMPSKINLFEEENDGI